MQFTLHQDKVTKGAIRYKEDSEDRPISVYLTKEQATQIGTPKSITVTIEPVK